MTKHLGDLHNEDLRYGVSVVIPTWRDTPTLRQAIESVLNQTLSNSFIELIIVVNGGDTEYFDATYFEFGNIPNVRVLFTHEKGAGVARNIGTEAASMQYISYLDDDDLYTEGYLSELLELTDHGVSIVMGKMDDFDKGDILFHNSTIRAQKGNSTEDYLSLSMLFSGLSSKLFDTKLMKHVFLPIPEDVNHAEDGIFWMRNFDRLEGKIALVAPNSSEAYLRRLQEGSLSQPSPDKLCRYAEERLAFSKEELNLICSNTTDENYKKFLMKRVSVDENHLKMYCKSDNSGKTLQMIRNHLVKHSEIPVNRAPFAEAKGIAFCQFFSPTSDASAYATARRFSQISEHENTLIDWKVIRQKYEGVQNLSTLFNQMYIKPHYGKFVVVEAENSADHEYWGKRAFGRTIFSKAQFVYSRSAMPGSHIAAHLYKALYPDTIWYAEFSDSAVVGSEAKASLDMTGTKIGQALYDKVDFVIAASPCQIEHIFKDCVQNDLADMHSKSLDWQYPRIPRGFTNCFHVDYFLDDRMINIACFTQGSMSYDFDKMLEFLKNPRVVLHIFNPNFSDPKSSIARKQINDLGSDNARLKIGNRIAYLETLALAARMDYVYLDDSSGSCDETNSCLLSKCADYLVTGSRVIALIQPESSLSLLEDINLTKVNALDDDFVRSLGA